MLELVLFISLLFYNIIITIFQFFDVADIIKNQKKKIKECKTHKDA